MNDKEFTVVARNVIMLMVALYFDVKTAVPMIIHIWYSVTLPYMILETLQNRIMNLIDEVCIAIENNAIGEVAAEQETIKVFEIKGCQLQLTLKNKEWFKLLDFFDVPDEN